MPDALPFFFFSRHIHICRNIINYRHITSHRHSAAGTEAQVTALLERVKELTGMPVSVDLFTTAPVLQIL
jgi:hypothetical protein